eukprot:gnl/MRDRNA2_/MRDRNA2_146709_c0_seq1.p1 gnl/MRDRNA2_/MRDRNA2_146709_c0~~gnl/MRDRNA2_/MRDRNA2_146709_c0_seq1.p1  ORF type:complete len:944 (+),score=178.99 gnl/MRDRNA2_/MRDRNA2_146709_c0_seq1:285-2834(+)
MTLLKLTQGQIVCKEGGIGLYFFVINGGDFGVSKSGDREAREEGASKGRKSLAATTMVATLHKGQSFGEIALLQDVPRTASVQVVSEFGSCWAVDKKTFWSVVGKAKDRGNQENKDFLGAVTLFSELNEEQKRKIAEAAVPRNDYVAGQVIIKQGDEGSSMFLLKSGSCLIYIGGALKDNTGEWVGGKKVGAFSQGDCFGERALLYEEPRAATVICDDTCSFLELERDKLMLALGGDLNALLRVNVIGTALRKESCLFKRLSEKQQYAVIEALEDLHMNPNISLSKVLPLGGPNNTQLWYFIVVLGTVTYAKSDDPDDIVELKPGSIFGDDYSRHSKIAYEFTAGYQGCRLAAGTNNSLNLALKRTDFGRGANIDVMIDQELKSGILVGHWIFRHLSPYQIERIAASMKITKYQYNQLLFEQGDPGTGFYIIAKGEANVIIVTPHPRPGQPPNKKVVATFGKNQYIGERALIYGEPRAATVAIASKEGAELWFIEQTVFKRIVNERLLAYLVIEIELQKKDFPLEDLERVNMLGKGALGPVKMVEHQKTKKRYALKCQHIRTLVETGKMEAFERESTLLQAVDHPFIVRFVQTYEEETWVYLLTELVTGGQLSKALLNLDTKKPAVVKFYVATLFLALEYLHGRNVAYRNLKPEIVMIDSQGYPKVIDFLNAKRITGRTYTSVGTPHYMAPEVIGGKGYGTSADLWSLGVFCYSLTYGKLPFADGEVRPMEICKAVVANAEEVRADLTQKTTANTIEHRIAAQITRQFLEPDPERRVVGKGMTGYQEIRKHVFFQELMGKDIDEQKETYFDMLLSRSIDPPFVPKQEYVGTPLADDEKEEKEEGDSDED